MLGTSVTTLAQLGMSSSLFDPAAQLKEPLLQGESEAAGAGAHRMADREAQESSTNSSRRTLSTARSRTKDFESRMELSAGGVGGNLSYFAYKDGEQGDGLGGEGNAEQNSEQSGEEEEEEEVDGEDTTDDGLVLAGNRFSSAINYSEHFNGNSTLPRPYNPGQYIIISDCVSVLIRAV